MSLPFLMLWLLPLLIMVWAFSSGRRDLHYPAVLSWIYMAWIVPQAIFIEQSALKDIYGTDALWLYATGAFIAATAGFYFTKNRRTGGRRRPRAPMEFDERRLTLAAAGLVAIGIISLILTIRTVHAQELGAAWTGIATAFYLLSQTAYVGIAIAALQFIRKPSILLAGIIIVGLIGVMPAVLVLVKRNVLFELAVIAGGALFFGRRMSPPRVVVFAAMFFGTIIIHQVASVRSYVQMNDATFVDALVEGVPFQNFAYFDVGKAPELSKAAVDIYVVRQTGDYEWGVVYLNKMVHQYVPSFLLGSELKEALKLDTRQGLDEIAIEDFEWRGATSTGFADSFRSFQGFGVLVFLLIGMMCGSIYRRAIEGSLIAQLFYVILLNDALFAFTDSTARFISQIPFIAIVAFAAFFFAKKRTKRVPTPLYPRRELRTSPGASTVHG